MYVHLGSQLVVSVVVGAVVVVSRNYAYTSRAHPPARRPMTLSCHPRVRGADVHLGLKRPRVKLYPSNMCRRNRYTSGLRGWIGLGLGWARSFSRVSRYADGTMVLLLGAARTRRSDAIRWAWRARENVEDVGEWSGFCGGGFEQG